MGFGPQGWDLGVEEGIWALKLILICILSFKARNLALHLAGFYFTPLSLSVGWSVGLLAH